jgi:monofunctional biosynthetic peptidoglycan transglycosylase
MLTGLACLILAWRFAPPVSTLMLARWAFSEPVERRDVPLDEISPHLVAAVILSEDSQFCRHNGVDWNAMREVIGKAGAEGPARGASTITMQTAKNLFLWPARSYLRKMIEVPLALTLDATWPKRRILEAYLNIAEWGNGIFGAEAAARHYFGKSALRLEPFEAALLAVALPAPHRRDAANPARLHVRLARGILARMRTADSALVDCAR